MREDREDNNHQRWGRVVLVVVVLLRGTFAEGMDPVSRPKDDGQKGS